MYIDLLVLIPVDVMVLCFQDAFLVSSSYIMIWQVPWKHVLPVTVALKFGAQSWLASNSSATIEEPNQKNISPRIQDT
jgi:hypothetical protein